MVTPNIDWKARFVRLKAKLKAQGYTVRQVSRKLHDYAGMNDLVAKRIGYPTSPKTLEVDKNMSYRKQYVTLRHEVMERALMAKGTRYWAAHCKTLKKVG